MINFVTLNTIVTDLLLIIRGSQLTQSEPISKRQVEGWVHATRAKILKQDLDKGKVPNPDYIQTIQALELYEVDETEDTTLSSDYKTFRTTVQMPKTLDLNFTSGFMYIGTVNGQEIQFIPESRKTWQEYKKYTSSTNNRIAYLKEGYLYVTNDKELRYVTVRGVFEIPPEVSHLVNPQETITDVTANSEYPMPIDKIPILKQMILQQELGVEARAYSDVTNESASKIEAPVEGVSHSNRMNSRS